MAKITLTDRWLKSRDRGPAARGGRDMFWDAALPGFGLRITDSGAATFIVMRRINGKVIRRTVGRSWKVPIAVKAELPFELARVRDEARAALSDMAAGVDPKAKREEAARVQEAEQRASRRLAENTFEAVAERFIAEHVAKLRSSRDVSNAIRRELITRWGPMPVTEVRRADVVKMLRIVAKDRLHLAHHLLAYTSKLFNWAIAQEEFDGLQQSPCDRLKGKDVLPPRKARQRILSDDDLVALWQATDPKGPAGLLWSSYVRLLIFTAQRLREVAEATWTEIDLDAATWTISAARMKADRPHQIPLSGPAVAILRALPRGTGPFVFSTTGGRRPIQAFSQAKKGLDERMPCVAAWRFHDLRRTARTHFGAIPVEEHVRERVIAHAQPTLSHTYDLFAYGDEKRFLMDRWAARLLAIVESTTNNVVRFALAVG